MNNLTQRICSAAVLILILVVLIHPATTIPLKATAIGFISLIILWEYSRLFKSRLFRIFFPILVIGGLLEMLFFTGYLEKTSNYLFWFLCFFWGLCGLVVFFYFFFFFCFWVLGFFFLDFVDSSLDCLCDYGREKIQVLDLYQFEQTMSCHNI